MRLDKPDQKKYKYVYTTISKFPSVDFFPKFASFLSLSQTESASLPSLINLGKCHIFYCYYCYSGITQIDKKNAKSIKNRE